MEKDKLTCFIEQIEELTKKPEKYLSVEENQVNFVKALTKKLYDFTKQNEYPNNKASDVLKKLVITNLDEEQVWQQIDLQNNSVCNIFIREIANLSAKKESLIFPLKNKNNRDSLIEQKIKNNVTENKLEKKIKCAKWKSSIVDDKFFKLHEMENFLVMEEEKERKKNDDVDEKYLEDNQSSSDEDDNEKQLYYNDFFDQPEEVHHKVNSESSFDLDNTSDRKKEVKFALYGKQDEDENTDDRENSDGSESMYNFENHNEDNSENYFKIKLNNDVSDDDGNNSDDDNNDKSIESNSVEKGKNYKNPSTFETRQERLKVRIKNLEEEALKEKPWQLKGEITANNRPQNSLLEEYVEFDIAARPAPVLTEKSTIKLEDVIIQRIKDKAWDDVVRKIKPVENDIEYKKKLVLDQEKSKLSLAQIYEKEYLKQLESKNEEIIEKPEKELKEHKEIRIMMNNLFSKLDALSNFHFTPKLVTPEVKIISNIPAINIEEVAPVATSDAALLAPEEIKPKFKGDLIGKSERTRTDKKRERRQRKLKQKLKYKQMEAKLKLKLDNSDPKNSQKKQISQKLLQKIIKSSNVTKLNEAEAGKFVKSSNAFFSKLQNETKSLIKKKNFESKKKLSKNINLKKSAAR